MGELEGHCIKAKQSLALEESRSIEPHVNCSGLA